MSFSRVRTAGLWVDGSTVAGSEFETLDANLANALDMLGGGAYSLAANVNVGGGVGIEWNFDLPVDFNDAVTFFQPVFFDESTTFDGPVNFYHPVSFADDVTFSDPVVFNDTTDFNFAANFDAAAFFNSDVYLGNAPADSLLVYATSAFTGNATFDGTADFNGAVTFDGAAAYTGTVVTNSAGNFRVRRVHRQTLGADADATIDVTLTDHVTVLPGVLSAARNYTISDTGAVNGDRVRFSNFDTTFGIVIENPSGTTIAGLTLATGVPRWCDVERISGAWRVFPGDREA